MTTTEIRKRRTAVPHYRGENLRLPRHPIAPDPSDLDGVRRWVRSAPRPTAIDLFSGAGGLSLGLRDAGFSVLLGADWDARAVETHEAKSVGSGTSAISPTRELIDYLEGWGITDVDLVAGGPPCQPFSRAGRSMIRNLVATGAAAPRIRARTSGRASWPWSSTATACGARRERPRSSELGGRKRADGLLRVAQGPRVHGRCTSARRAFSTACHSTGRACSSSACESGRVRVARTRRLRSRRCGTRSVTSRRCRPAQRAERIPYCGVPRTAVPGADA